MSEYDYYLPEMIRRAMENEKLLEGEDNLRAGMSREQFYRQFRTLIFSVPRRHGKTRAIMDNYSLTNNDIIVYPTMQLMQHICSHEYIDRTLNARTYEMMRSEADQRLHNRGYCGVVYVDEIFLCNDTVEGVLSTILDAFEPTFIVALGTA